MAMIYTQLQYYNVYQLILTYLIKCCAQLEMDGCIYENTYEYLGVYIYY